MDLRHRLPRDYRLLIDRHRPGQVGRAARVPLRKVVDLPDQLDRVGVRRSSLAGGIDLHESFNGQ